MKKTLFLLVLCAFAASCNNIEKSKDEQNVRNKSAGIVNTAPNLPSDSIYIENGNYLCHQVDSGTVARNSAVWNRQMLRVLYDSNSHDTISQVFVISASDLLRAILDSPGVSEIVFYLAANPKDTVQMANDTTLHLPPIYNPTLYYAPARFLGRGQKLKVLMYPSDSLNLKKANPYLFDNTVPCPTCLVINGPDPSTIVDTVIYSHKKTLHHHK